MVSADEILHTGQTMVEMKGDEGKILKKNYFCCTDGVMKCNPAGWVLPTNFKKIANLIYNFKYNATDVMVTSFPKSGTTWTQEIVWNLSKNPDLDNKEAYGPLDARFPNIEGDLFLATTGADLPDEDSDIVKMFHTLYPGEDISEIQIKMIAFAPSPRFMKAHLSLVLFPKDLLERCKVIYVAREVRDVVYSLYHYARLQKLWGFRGTLDEFVDDVVNDRVIFGPYYQHLKEAWDRRDHPNMLFIFYEDLHADINKEVKRIDQFIGTNRNEKQIQNVIDFTSFSALKERSKENPPSSNFKQYFDDEIAKKEGSFFRKGIVGDWKNHFNQEQVKKLSEWAEKNLRVFGPDFKYNNMY